MSHANFFFQVASCSFVLNECMMKEGHKIRLVAVEPETMPMAVQIKLTTKKIHNFCPSSGSKLSNRKISNGIDMLIFISFKVQLK